MAIPTNFSEIYKTVTNSELLHILENPDEYQPAAIEAAQQEFVSRDLTEAEINEARKSLFIEQNQKEQYKEKFGLFEDKIKLTGSFLITSLNPMQTGITSAEKRIRLIVVAFSALFLYQLFRDFELLKIYFQEFQSSPFEYSLILFPFLAQPLAIFSLWKKKKMGWILFTILLVFDLVGTLWTFYDSIFGWPSGLESIDSLFPSPSPTLYILPLLVLVGTLVVLCKKYIREIYFISLTEMQATILISAIVSFFLTLAVS